MASKTVVAPKTVTVALATGALILAEYTGHGEKHIQVEQEREIPPLVGTAILSAEILVTTTANPTITWINQVNLPRG